jgi:DMSO/TMAO reductase YedYZ molybdopterin-dependent catalytic subunit
MRRHRAGAACGIVAAGLGVAVAELLAAATRPEAGPLVAVGGAVIDATPTPVKELAVRELGTHDKPALLAGIVLVLALFTAAVGTAASRYRIAAVTVGVAVFGAAGAGAALSRPAATAFDAVPSLCGALVAGVALAWLTVRICGGGLVAPRDGSAVAFDRRRFLRSAALVAGGAFVTQGGAGLVKAARGGAADRTRHALRLPPAADPAAPLPAGAAPGFVTTNADFYRVDTALTVPRIDPDTWSLRIHGMVDRELRLSLPDVLARPLIERDITLNCVSNEVGGPYAGTARWLGVPLAPLLREAAIRPGADQVVARSVDGMTIGTPVATVLDGRDTMLVVGMNGEPLPLTHGFPVRMLTPGLYGYAGACKWLDRPRFPAAPPAGTPRPSPSPSPERHGTVRSMAAGPSCSSSLRARSTLAGVGSRPSATARSSGSHGCSAPVRTAGSSPGCRNCGLSSSGPPPVMNAATATSSSTASATSGVSSSGRRVSSVMIPPSWFSRSS